MGPWFGTGGVWTRKVPISLVQTATDGTAADWDITIPSGLDDFWNTVDAAGNELRVTDAVGTLLAYSLSGFNRTNRTGTIRLDGVANPAAAHVQLAWLFYGSTTNQGDGATGSGAGGKTGYIELARPGGPYVVRHAPQIPGTTLPVRTFHKSANEVADLWVQLAAPRGAMLPYNSSPGLECPRYLTQTVEDTSGATTPTSTMADISLARFVWGPRIGMWARCIVKAGSSGTNYTSTLLTRIVSPIDGISVVKSTLETRVGWRVRDNRISS